MKKYVLFLLLLTIAVFTSGCIFGESTDQITGSDYIPQNNLPAGLTYMGIHDAAVNIGDSSLNANEGFYRTDKGDDAYIQVIENSRPEALLAEYRLQYKDANYNPFEEISFNGHKATRVTD